MKTQIIWNGMVKSTVNSIEDNNQSKMKNIDKSDWAIGGGTMLGIGVGFFFLTINIMWFVGSILAGVGLGLLVTSILSSVKK